jgi:dCTP deaminase
MAKEGILADSEIRAAVADGRIRIEPFRDDHVNPTSYDVTLGDELTVYDKWVRCVPNDKEIEDGFHWAPTAASWQVLDPKNDDPNNAGFARHFKINPEVGWVIRPGIGYLMHTHERIQTTSFVPIIDGKSTVGRLFVAIHQTAGYGDPGFDGQFTLEVTATHAIRLYPGMLIGQVRFHTICGEVGKLYSERGNYTRGLAQGPVASAFRRLFRV